MKVINSKVDRNAESVKADGLNISIPPLTEDAVITSPKPKPRKIKYEPLVIGDRYRGIGYDDYCCLCGGDGSTFGTFVYYSKPQDVVTYHDLEKGVYPELLTDSSDEKGALSLKELHCGCCVHSHCLQSARKKDPKARCPPNEHDTVMKVNRAPDLLIWIMSLLCLLGVPAVIGAIFLYSHFSGL